MHRPSIVKGFAVVAATPSMMCVGVSMQSQNDEKTYLPVLGNPRPGAAAAPQKMMHACRP